jgi:hypothetical protein
MFDKTTYPRSAMDMNNDRGASQRMPGFAKGASLDFGSFNKTWVKS